MKQLNLVLLAGMLISCSATASPHKSSQMTPVPSAKKAGLLKCETRQKASKCQIASKPENHHRHRVVARHATASWYGPGFHGKKTASGERFNQYALTAAHKTLPLGTHVRIRNLDNDRSVVVKINDRGPFAKGRAIDLSKGAAMAIGMSGVGHVEIIALN